MGLDGWAPIDGKTMSDPRYRQTTLELLRQALGDAEAATTDQGTVRLEVRGWCMEPLLRDGDRVWIAPLAGPPRVGELLLAHEGDQRLVCHRVLTWSDGSGWLAGDRSQRLERHTTAEILGRLSVIERRGRLLRVPHAPRLDALLARWHHLAWRRRGTFPGRLLEALRWRLVVARARFGWRARAHKQTDGG